MKDRATLERMEFYAQDVRILEGMGHDVLVATRVRELRRADLYFVWWWTWAFVPVLLGRLLRRPVLITGTLDAYDYAKRPFWERALIRLALREATSNVFVSELEYREIPKMMTVHAPHYSPHVVDTTLYRPVSAAREEIVFSVVWMHGRNARRKCVDELLHAAAIVCHRHPSVRFVIAGERGSAYPGIAELAASLKLQNQVTFPGPIDRATKIELMQRCKVYLQPSRFEGFGLAILEAMSCGAAVVTSPAGAVPEVAGDAALLVDGTDPPAIARAVGELLDDDQLRESLGRRGRARAESVFPFERRRRELSAVLDAATRAR